MAASTSSSMDTNDFTTVYRLGYNDYVRKCKLCNGESGSLQIVAHCHGCKYWTYPTRFNTRKSIPFDLDMKEKQKQ